MYQIFFINRFTTMNIRPYCHLLAILITLLCYQCKVSLSGASISPDTKTVSITAFTNKATKVYPPLARLMAEELRNNFTNQTRLDVVANEGDLQFDATITDYSIRPATLQAQGASQNQLTIAVQVAFINNKEKSKSFEQSFTRFAPFPSTQNFNTIEAALAEEVTKLLMQDVLNKAIINW